MVFADLVEEFDVLVGVAAFDKAVEVVVVPREPGFLVSSGGRGVFFVDDEGFFPEGAGGRDDAEVYG